jgi:hypothetical protein
LPKTPVVGAPDQGFVGAGRSRERAAAVNRGQQGAHRFEPAHRTSTICKAGSIGSHLLPESGSYSFDCELGTPWGEALLPILRRDPDILRCIVLGMAARGQGGIGGADRGLIVGLMGVVGQALAQPAAPVLAFTRPEPAAGRTSP